MIDLINASSEKCCLPDISCMDESAPVFSLIYLVEERRGGDEDENKIYIKMVNHDFEFITMNNGVFGRITENGKNNSNEVLRLITPSLSQLLLCSLLANGSAKLLLASLYLLYYYYTDGSTMFSNWYTILKYVIIIINIPSVLNIF